MPIKIYDILITEYPDLKDISDCSVCLVAFEVRSKYIIRKIQSLGRLLAFTYFIRRALMNG